MSQSNQAGDAVHTEDDGRLRSMVMNRRHLIRVHTLALKPGIWNDISYGFSSPANLRDAAISLFCRTEAFVALNLRLAALTLKDGVSADAYQASDIDGVARLAVEIQPGYSSVEIKLNHLRLQYGPSRLERVDVLLFGGEVPFAAEVHCVCLLKTSVGVYELFGPDLTLVEAGTAFSESPAYS